MAAPLARTMLPAGKRVRPVWESTGTKEAGSISEGLGEGGHTCTLGEKTQPGLDSARPFSPSGKPGIEAVISYRRARPSLISSHSKVTGPWTNTNSVADPRGLE